MKKIMAAIVVMMLMSTLAIPALAEVYEVETAAEEVGGEPLYAESGEDEYSVVGIGGYVNWIPEGDEYCVQPVDVTEYGGDNVDYYNVTPVWVAGE